MTPSTMPIVTIQQSPRDLAAKRQLVEGVTAAFVAAYGLPPERVSIFIEEFDDDAWASGGRLACDTTPDVT